ncbi:MAG: TetR/AcrR family transcriptional regulator [Candidatus Nanopelagicales bacterium]
MPRTVKSKPGRRYDSSRRKASADQTRAAILVAARDLFTERGYAATTVAAIADEAGVAVDTLYATVGKKPEVFGELIELALSGVDVPVPALERDYVKRINQVATADEKLALYAAAVTSIQGRLAPLFVVFREGAAADPAVARLWNQISQRRAKNMRMLAAELRGTGKLRQDLTDDQVADIIWSMNSADFYTALVTERGWEPEGYREFLVDAWSRLLLS